MSFVCLQQCLDPLDASLWASCQFVLPDANYVPAGLPQSLVDHSVTRPIRRQLPFPECSVVRRHVCMFRAAVPETAIDKDGDAVHRKHEVRLAEYRLIPTPAGDAVLAEERQQGNLR